MKKLWLLFVLIPSSLLAQEPFHFTIFGGAANYQGDLRNKRFAVDQSQLAIGVGIKYDINIRLAFRSSISFAKVEGDDKKNVPSLRYRNLSFQSKVFEWASMIEYSFLDLQQAKFSPYVFAGLGIFHFNPYTTDTLGANIYLQPLGTEGQGLSQYPDRKKYNLTQFNIPFGGGIRFLVSKNVSLAYEFGFRKLFTDYLDDVSTTYADKDILMQGRGPEAVELAYRAGELIDGNPLYPAEGSQRGKGKLKDWYYFHGIMLIFNFGEGKDPKDRNSSGRKFGKISCPKV